MSLRKRSLEKKNFCILIFELMFLAFFAGIGELSDLHWEMMAALLSDLTAYSRDELVAAYSTDSFQTQSLQQDELEAAYSYRD